MEDWITNLGTGLAVAIVTSVVTVRLSLRKFHAERWWERKAEAYNDVLNALSDLKHYSELLAKQAYGAKFTEEHQARLKERHLDGYHKLRSARTIGGFILSEAVAQHLEKLARQDDTIDRDWPTLGVLRRDFRGLC